MNIVMIIPTGIGCEIGGHAGDATPAARLLGSVCDKIILHPNVVNASDINEMPENALYVEGSILDRFLEGKIELQEVKQNTILIVVNKPIKPETQNAVSAARSTLGVKAEILELNTPLQMIGFVKNGKAGGRVSGWEELVEQVSRYKFDALAISTPIELEDGVAINYFKNGGVNPWGKVEAIASKLIANKLNKPVDHAPVIVDDKEWTGSEFRIVCDPRMGAEIISRCFFHCVLKGLHKSPIIGKGLSIENIDAIVSPFGCWGRPHIACEEADIPIIIVKENKTVLNDKYPDTNNLIFVENYLEVAGVVSAIKSGISLESVKRPLIKTRVI